MWDNEAFMKQVGLADSALTTDTSLTFGRRASLEWPERTQRVASSVISGSRALDFSNEDEIPVFAGRLRRAARRAMRLFCAAALTLDLGGRRWQRYAMFSHDWHRASSGSSLRLMRPASPEPPRSMA